jgi:hypothetical protein
MELRSCEISGLDEGGAKVDSSDEDVDAAELVDGEESAVEEGLVARESD